MTQKILLFGVLVFAAFVVYSLTDQRHPIDFEIPQGYVGWIRVKSNILGAAPLPMKSGHYIAHIPANGLLKTSTIEEEGGAADRFYYVNQAQQRMPIDGFRTNVNLIQGDRGRTNERYMFIGTKQQFGDAQRLIGGSDPGPLKLPITENYKREFTESLIKKEESNSARNSAGKLDSISNSSPFRLPPIAQSNPKKP